MTGKIKSIFIVAFAILVVPLPVYATTTYQSTNYQTNQVQFGAGGARNLTSSNYGAQVSVGETGVGNYSSSNYQAWAGFNTDSQPFLEAVVTSANLDLGVLSSATTATATATFYVRAWNAKGYVVQTDSPPPTNIDGGHVMTTNSTPAANNLGHEQFGMNLVADTTPASLTTASPASANPQQTLVYPYTAPTSCPPVSSSAIAYGCAYGNYVTPNQYAYNNGDVIAASSVSTSKTIYVVSYIFNISNSTPAGQYVFHDNFVITATY
jgi:hypothetical protein